MKEAKKYTCTMTKNEIVNIIIEQFEAVNEEYSKALKDDDNIFLERAFGKYIAMIDLLKQVQIYEN